MAFTYNNVNHEKHKFAIFMTNRTVDEPLFRSCGSFSTGFHPNAIWFADRPTDYVFPDILLQLILMFSISRMIYFVLGPLKQSRFVCNVTAGIILGPSVLGRNKGFLHRISRPREMVISKTLSIIGLLYYIFFAAIKIDKSRIITTARQSLKIGLTCFLVPTLMVFFLFSLFGKTCLGIPEGAFHFHLSATTSLSYFSVMSHTLSELNLLTTELGKVSMSCTVLHEILGWLVFSFTMFVWEGQPSRTALSVGSMFVLILLVILVLRPVIMWIIKTSPEGKPVDGFYVKAILFGPLIMATLTDLLGATVLPGAFIMGLIIPSGPPLGSSLIEKSELIVSQLFIPFLYIRFGQLTNLESITDWKAFMVLQLIMLSGFLGKVVGCLLSLLWSSSGVQNTFLIGLILNNKGVVELMLLARWKSQGFVDEPSYAALVIYFMLASAISTPLVKIFFKTQERLEASSSMKSCLRTLQGMPLTEEFRILCCIHSEENIRGIISLIKACSSSNGLTPVCIYAVHLVDLVGRATPLLQPYNSQRKRCKMSLTDRIMESLTKCLIKSTPGSQITIQPFKLVAPFKSIHQLVCGLAEDKFTPLVLVPFPESLETHGRTMALRNFNLHMQALAPCTVGVLVDRSLPQVLLSADFCYNVKVIFIGGPDDREALAMVLRMSRHPGVSINVLRISLREDDEQNESEKYLDNSMISEFITKNIGNNSVVYSDLVAESTMQVVDLIRSGDQTNYDLMIVGKQRGPNSQLEAEMLPWVEHKELGAIGDMVASSDFCGGMVSVLVLHCVEGYAEVCTTSSLTILDGKSQFSFSSSSCDTDNKGRQVLLYDSKRDVRNCTEV